MAKTKSFILSDESVNTYGFRVLLGGVDLAQFRRNPVMFYNHDEYDMPIGLWDNIRIEDGKLLADPVFDLEDENAAKIAGKVERGFLRSASIGLRVLERSDDPVKMLPGQRYATVTRCQLREVSIVNIGANHNALRLYDENDKLLTEQQIIQLFDNPKPQEASQQKFNMNKATLDLLKLADSASDEQLYDAVRQIVEKNATLEAEIKTLKDEKQAREEADKAMRQREAVSLVDAAVKDGRLNAEGKENFLKFFETDFEVAKKTLLAIPKRVSVKEQIEKQAQDNSELADFNNSTWDELDKAGKLARLKEKYPDLYAEKFQAKFGKKPVNI